MRQIIKNKKISTAIASIASIALFIAMIFPMTAVSSYADDALPNVDNNRESISEHIGENQAIIGVVEPYTRNTDGSYQSGGSIELNTSTGRITTNKGRINENEGTVVNNESGAMINTNKTDGVVQNNAGSLYTNQEGAVVNKNIGNGYVGNNNGTIEENEARCYNSYYGKVKKNTGRIMVNAGTVSNNLGTIESNTGNVLSNSGTIISSTSGVITQTEIGVIGTVTNGSVTGGTIECLDFYNGQNLVLSDCTIKLRIDGAGGTLDSTVQVLQNVYRLDTAYSADRNKINITGASYNGLNDIVRRGDKIYMWDKNDGEHVASAIISSNVSGYKISALDYQGNYGQNAITITDNGDGTFTLTNITTSIDLYVELEKIILANNNPYVYVPIVDSKNDDENQSVVIVPASDLLKALTAPEVVKAVDGSGKVIEARVVYIDSNVVSANTELTKSIANVFLQIAGKEKLDIAKAQVVNYYAIETKKNSTITFADSKCKFSPEDLVFAVFVDSVTGKTTYAKVTKNPDGTISVKVPYDNCIMTLVKM